MYNESEITLLKATGSFSTIAQWVYPGSSAGDNYGTNRVPGQCVRLLITTEEFIVWVECFDIAYAPENSIPSIPKLTFTNKRFFPAKITGLGLAHLQAATIGWREELINSKTSNQNLYFRPGYGELIPNDLSRPLKTTVVARNDLGLGSSAIANSASFCGPLGRLMSAAFYIDPAIAIKYEQSKKQQVNLNGDKVDPPTYLSRPYTPVSGGGGY